MKAVGQTTNPPGQGLPAHRSVVSRRTFVRAAAITPLLSFTPGRFFWGVSVVSEAEAAWIAVAQAVLSALSFFIGGDNGMSAMLSNIQELQQESIRLTQAVLVELGKIEGILQQLPSVIRDQLTAHSEFRVREDTEQIRLDLAFAERADRGSERTERLRAIVDKATALARFQSVPYGIGATAAICAPLVCAIDGRARQLLGHRSELKNAVEIYYLPWLRQIQSNTPGSVLSALNSAAVAYNAEVSSLEDALPAILKTSPGIDFFRSALALDPGGPPLTKELGYVFYAINRNHIRGPRWLCEIQAALKVGVTAQNEFIDPADVQGDQQPGPNLTFSTNTEDVAPINKTISADGAPTVVDGHSVYAWKFATVVGSPLLNREQQKPALREKFADTGFEAALQSFISTKVMRINECRRSIYAMSQLLTSIRQAENLLERVTA